MHKASKQYANRILKLLQDHYPDAKMILNWTNNFELLVAIILSAQCTDKKVNEVTAKLFPKYRKIRIELRNLYKKYISRVSEEGGTKKTKNKGNPGEEEIVETVNFAEVPIKELEMDIKSTGFYHNKAKNIQAAAKVVLEKYQSILPRSITELITIPGVGRKSANVFLGNAYGIFEGIAVDTHVTKQSQVLGLTTQTKPDKIEQELMSLFDKKDWFRLTYLLIEHGRNMRRKVADRKSCNDKECTLCCHKRQ